MKKILQIGSFIFAIIVFLFMVFSAGYFFGTEDYFKGIVFTILSVLYLIVQLFFTKFKAEITSEETKSNETFYHIP